MTWAEYVREVIGGDTQQRVAERVGEPQPVISKWLRGRAVPTSPKVTNFVFTYGGTIADVFYAWLICGHVTPEQYETLARSTRAKPRLTPVA